MLSPNQSFLKITYYDKKLQQEFPTPTFFTNYFRFCTTNNRSWHHWRVCPQRFMNSQHHSWGTHTTPYSLLIHSKTWSYTFSFQRSVSNLCWGFSLKPHSLLTITQEYDNTREDDSILIYQLLFCHILRVTKKSLK